jgi:hypothetical protein
MNGMPIKFLEELETKYHFITQCFSNKNNDQMLNFYSQNNDKNLVKGSHLKL